MSQLVLYLENPIGIKFCLNITCFYYHKSGICLHLNVVIVDFQKQFLTLFKVVPISTVMSTGPLPVSSSTPGGFYSIREDCISFVHSKQWGFCLYQSIRIVSSNFKIQCAMDGRLYNTNITALLWPTKVLEFFQMLLIDVRWL